MAASFLERAPATPLPIGFLLSSARVFLAHFTSSFSFVPPGPLVFERKRETLEVARKNSESITIASELYNFSDEFNYIIFINFIIPTPSFQPPLVFLTFLRYND